MFYKEEFSLEQFCQESIYSWYVPNFCIITILLINRPRNTHRQKFKTSGVVFTPVIFNSMLALFLFCFVLFLFFFIFEFFGTPNKKLVFKCKKIYLGSIFSYITAYEKLHMLLLFRYAVHIWKQTEKTCIFLRM